MAYASDKEGQDLTALTAPAASDIVPIVDDPAGTPLTKKITLTNLFKVIAELTGITSGIAKATDLLAIVDGGSGGTPKSVTPANLLKAVERYVEMVVVDFTADTATGDGQFYFHVPTELNGLNLTYVHAEVITAGTTGTLDIQIRNVTDAVDMLSTKITIDSAETGSDTAATPAVIDTTNDDVATNDLLAVDIDVIHTTAARGLIVTLGFSL